MQIESWQRLALTVSARVVSWPIQEVTLRHSASSEFQFWPPDLLLASSSPNFMGSGGRDNLKGGITGHKETPSEPLQLKAVWKINAKRKSIAELWKSSQINHYEMCQKSYIAHGPMRKGRQDHKQTKRL